LKRFYSTRNPPKDFLNLFPDVAQTIINTRLENLWHTPLLKSGGDAQEKLARRLDRIGKLSTVAMQMMAQKMTAALRSVIGCYYVLKVTPDKLKATYINSRTSLNKNIVDLENRRGEKTAAGMETIEAIIARMTLEGRLLKELIEEGTPEAISDFTAKCEYCRHTADHKTERLIRIENTQGEKTKLLSLAFSRLSSLPRMIFCIFLCSPARHSSSCSGVSTFSPGSLGGS
jgi:hypothetical protein